jgi:hypothetical protein
MFNDHMNVGRKSKAKIVVNRPSKRPMLGVDSIQVKTHRHSTGGLGDGKHSISRESGFNIVENGDKQYYQTRVIIS